MERVIADASVLAKLFLQEEHSDKAYELRDSYISEELEIIEPTLMQYELLNALRFTREERISEEDIKESLDAIENYNFKIIHLDSKIVDRALFYSVKYGVSIYDAIYVAMADIYRATFYTADGPVLEKIKKPFIKHIKDYGK